MNANERKKKERNANRAAGMRRFDRAVTDDEWNKLAALLEKLRSKKKPTK